ncbi:MAG: SDR family NAD(P)-dependent oxidoreductase, partial [Erysipelotrichaceae bacterium]|nr:SDR family NAD(P)-dependent oxidoreductase [Erysipelotrichaceae bacterium]
SMNKIVLITGATSGIGLACARKFAENGDKLILTGRNEQRLNEIKKELEWLSAFDENENNDEDAINYMDTISNDIFNANVYVLTPKGRVIDLPNGSCPIDFAYRIHTEVGHQTVGSKVNGVLVPLNTQLKTGDVVEIMTDKKSGPSEDWIKICKSNNAKNRIRQYLTKKEQERKSEYVKQAEQTYVSELKKRNLDQEEFFDKEKIESIAKSLNCSGYADVMYNLATHQITVTNIIDRLSKNKRNDYDLDSLSQNLEKTQSKRRNALSKTGVIVNGVDSVKISMSSCCCPVYGDEIVGYVTKGLGVKVHRKNCSKIANIKERLINVSWDTFKDPNVKYETNLKIFCSNRNFLLTDVITMIAQYKATLLNVKSSLNQKDLTCTISVTMMVDDLNYLELLMANLRKINSVISVERINK